MDGPLRRLPQEKELLLAYDVSDDKCHLAKRLTDELSIFASVRNTCVAMGKFAEQIFDQSLQAKPAQDTQLSTIVAS